jgi:catechol 2,3-dioxygenase-like lactoylglutathione lyase family enzyme
MIETQTALKVTGIDHVVIYVSDLQRSRRFYMGLLGMTVAHENDRQCFLHCGNGQQVALFAAGAYGTDVRSGTELNHMALRLEAGEYEAVKARLEAEGCTVHGRPGDPNCLYFEDPDGHRLQVLTPAEQAQQH